MRVLIYGGSFNPPHLGHEAALRSAADAVHPDKILVIPSNIPPHKAMAEGSPSAEERLLMTRLAFSDFQEAEVSDLELLREGTSYTVETLRQIREEMPEAELFFLVGTDMLLYMEHWFAFEEIFSLCTLAALPREEGEIGKLESFAEYLRKSYDARIVLIRKPPLPMSSTQLRQLLPDRQGVQMLSPEVYGHIIRRRLYGARPELTWLRQQVDPWMKPSRIPHIRGVEQESVRLARRWGVDEGDAAEAGILHDITKRMKPDEQLHLCRKYGIILDKFERSEPKILHARTGAYFARDLFGVPDAVFDAIEWHTTGRAGMAPLEMIVYLADICEPQRDFPGVDRIREAVDIDLHFAMVVALERTIAYIREQGGAVHPRSEETLCWAKEQYKNGGSAERK